MPNAYEVSFEVAGPAAMFARPDTGSTPISYPVPTFSAAKGMFEAVARLKSAYIHPTRVEICRPIRYERYVTNYGGPLRKSNQIRDDNNYQFIATILFDVCYRIYGEVRGKRSSRGSANGRLKHRSGRTDHCQLLHERFSHRLENGQTYHTPCLGWKEFVPSYFGPFRAKDEKGKKIEPLAEDIVIPSLLHSMWKHRQLQPTFRQEWRIVNGVMSYEHGRPHNA